jgi:hypothetical protein
MKAARCDIIIVIDCCLAVADVSMHEMMAATAIMPLHKE